MFFSRRLESGDVDIPLREDFLEKFQEVSDYILDTTDNFFMNGNFVTASSKFSKTTKFLRLISTYSCDKRTCTYM